MTFTHRFIDLPSISSRDTPGGRFYQTPEGEFPSVTTVLGWHKGDEWLRKWIDRVGEDQARRVGTKARLRGTAVHNLAEKYLRNDPRWMAGEMPTTLDSFSTVRGILDSRVGTVYGIEVPLYSTILRTAGRTDLLADWDGVPSVIDFKTSTRIKKEDDIWGYFIQKTCYGAMVEERTGIDLPQIVTVMMVDHEPPQIWVKRRADYHEEMTAVFGSKRPDGNPV